MINTNGLYIVNYCHPNCRPFQNIMRLPKEQAFKKAKELAENNPEAQAFYRFADFENYYPRRLKADDIIHSSFVTLGGKPKEKHPLSFVLNGSEYLNKWFGYGTTVKLPLADIPSEQISFTYGDSSAMIEKTGKILLITKEMLLDEITHYHGTLDEYMSEIERKYCYIEVQLWFDDLIRRYL